MKRDRSIKVIVVDNGSMCPDILGIINSMFEVVVVRHPYQALETLRTSGGFDLVISYVHTPQMDEFQLQQIIAQQFQLPIVCFKCISAVMCVEEQQAMLADDLIHRWQFITDQMMCKEKSKMDWTDELHFKFADVVESLGGIKEAKPKEILKQMVKDVPGLNIKNISSHLQKYRKLKEKGWKRKNKMAKHDEQYNKCRIQQNRQLEASLSNAPFSSSELLDESMINDLLNLVCQDAGSSGSYDHMEACFSGDDGNLLPFVDSCSMDEADAACPDAVCWTRSDNNYYYPSENWNDIPGNIFGQDNYSDGGNHHHHQVEGWTYEISLQNHNHVFGEKEDNNSSYHSYSAQSTEHQQQFQVPLVGQHNNSGPGNYIGDNLINNFDNQLNIDQPPLTQLEGDNYVFDEEEWIESLKRAENDD